MSTSQNLFVQNLSLLVFPLFKKAGRLKNKEKRKHILVVYQMSLLTHNVPPETAEAVGLHISPVHCNSWKMMEYHRDSPTVSFQPLHHQRDKTGSRRGKAVCKGLGAWYPISRGLLFWIYWIHFQHKHTQKSKNVTIEIHQNTENYLQNTQTNPLFHICPPPSVDMPLNTVVLQTPLKMTALVLTEWNNVMFSFLS